MKIKTWHLFFVIIVLFGCSFYIVNLKFDKFYRVNGINNDNRVLIEKYLDKDEQTYLIDNQISIELFIDYLEFDDFHLQNYQYYNYLKESGRYKKTSEILDVANSLVTRLSYLYKDSAMNQAKLLIDRSLEMVFLSEENFRFDYIDLYTDLKPLYASQDYSYIEDAETYVQRFGEMGIDDFDDVKETMHMMTQAYSKDALADILIKLSQLITFCQCRLNQIFVQCAFFTEIQFYIRIQHDFFLNHFSRNNILSVNFYFFIRMKCLGSGRNTQFNSRIDTFQHRCRFISSL